MTKSKRSTIGVNPLDTVIPMQKTPAAEPTKVKKERVTFHLPADLIERARNSVFWTPGLTLATLAEEAIRDALDRIEKERGEPFPPRKRALKTGRPVK
jgi:hypothetical protein